MYKQRNETIHYEYNFGKYFVTWIVYQITMKKWYQDINVYSLYSCFAFRVKGTYQFTFFFFFLTSTKGLCGWNYERTVKIYLHSHSASGLVCYHYNNITDDYGYDDNDT